VISPRLSGAFNQPADSLLQLTRLTLPQKKQLVFSQERFLAAEVFFFSPEISLPVETDVWLGESSLGNLYVAAHRKDFSPGTVTEASTNSSRNLQSTSLCLLDERCTKQGLRAGTMAE
jgi:hypothetical protein